MKAVPEAFIIDGIKNINQSPHRLSPAFKIEVEMVMCTGNFELHSDNYSIGQGSA